MMEFFCGNVETMVALGQLLGRFAKSGDVFCLCGDLGAGKTTLCREIAIAQGVAASDVSSPTFSILNIYQGNMEIRHFDLYRLETEEELEDIGYEEYVGGKGLTLIEWADNFLEQMPEESLDINVTIVPEGRVVELSPCGERYEKLCEEVERHADFSH
ncbi:tRNA (adenosine(37)-N6)-threonylcarbamoyltransferase complex ATPase subunit type 1 TsaE [Phascolarctobacterium sp.]|uniref:tRNA (adenosine(37)-N6)-threonylcarbamoyltransferase complex ATPase subunit type 1 TsaE n=1 Tax=Phascolarctobacterium sp. TaxID=2049039 RepID=UPI0025F4C188|nr:tRNA (adenosine(37)-N6)-threonylcarbamoyltransferase complex ATPase subunit type 1 TsaE [uncultured Phascolarctobacterium sp.]